MTHQCWSLIEPKGGPSRQLPYGSSQTIQIGHISLAILEAFRVEV